MLWVEKKYEERLKERMGTIFSQDVLKLLIKIEIAYATKVPESQYLYISNLLTIFSRLDDGQ